MKTVNDSLLIVVGWRGNNSLFGGWVNEHLRAKNGTAYRLDVYTSFHD